MANLYYLLSSLPTLSFDREIPLTYERLMSDSLTLLDEGSFERLKNFSLHHPPLSLDGLGPLEKDYWNWDISLRNDLVRLRAEALGLKAEDYLRVTDVPGVAMEHAREAFRESNPLKVEESLDRARWALLESKKGVRIFDFEILLIYSMQLQILLRRASFEKEKGRVRYEDEYKHTLKSAETVLAENI